MRLRIQVWGIVLGLMLLAACGASPARIGVSEAWARAAAMTGASAAGGMNMGQGEVMTGTMAMGESHGSMSGEGDTAMASGGTSAAYMVLSNSGGSADALIKIESDVADTVELHSMHMENGVMRMAPVEKIEIPANGQAELKPGGLHVMLIGLRHDLKAGETIRLTLTFQHAGTMVVEAPVRAP